MIDRLMGADKSSSIVTDFSRSYVDEMDDQF
jgi:hypothetical protein